MSFRSILLIVLGAVSLALGGCGGSSPSHGTSAASRSSSGGPTRQGTTGSGTTTTKASPQASVSRTPTAPPTSPHTLTAPPPTPAGTPPAPDGLSQTTGYAMYELCASGCSGSVPASLRRSLHLPTSGAGGSCPVSAGSGPVKPSPSTALKLTPFVGSAWQGTRVNWTAPGYQGPILIRGRELGGPHAVGFGEGHVPYDELQFDGRAFGAPAGQWPSFTRVRGSGCYAYQIDGTSFSEVVVFRASS